MPPATAVVLAAHGSRLGEANDAHRALSERVAAQLGLAVRPGFLELAEPTIGQAIDDAAAGGARRILVLPYFLHPGNHTVADIPSIVTAAGRRHPDCEVRLLTLFGGDERVADVITGLLVDQIGSVDSPS